MFSLTYTGVAITVIGYLFNMAGVPFVPEEAGKVIEFIVVFVGVLTTLFGRWRAGGIRWFGARTE